MTIKLYMDHHVPLAITLGLRRSGVDVLTADEDGAARLPDHQLLDRATSLGRVLFTEDDDLLREAARRQRSGESFAGVIYVHQLTLSVGRRINELELICKASDPMDWIDQVRHLPL